MKKLRVSRGWTQEQLAEISGLHIRTVQRIERGHPPGLESLKCLAAAFDMETQRLKRHLVCEDGMFEGSSPILPARSVRETAAFYVEKLGFEIDVLWESPPYAVVGRGRTVIEFGEGRADVAGTGVCNIFVRDVDAVYREYRDRDLEFVGDLADRDYGNRDFRVRDNNGNLLIIGNPLMNQEALLKKGNVAP